MVAAPVTHTRWAREYETIYILSPDAPNAEAEKLAERLAETVKRLGGKLTRLDNWGRRRLAYPIRKNSRGVFVYVKYIGFSDLVAELERTLRITDAVVRFQTILVRKLVNPADITVDPEDVKFRHVETTDEESDPDLAERLGMVERKRQPRGEEFDAATDIRDEDIPDLNSDPGDSTERVR